MMTLLRSLLGTARSFVRTQRDLALENLALRHQIGVLHRTVGMRRLRLGPVDRGFWAGLSRIGVRWEQALAIVQKDLVSIDFFVVPTATFRVLFGLLVFAHDRRRVLHFNMTSNPSAA